MRDSNLYSFQMVIAYVLSQAEPEKWDNLHQNMLTHHKMLNEQWLDSDSLMDYKMFELLVELWISTAEMIEEHFNRFGESKYLNRRMFKLILDYNENYKRTKLESASMKTPLSPIERIPAIETIPQLRRHSLERQSISDSESFESQHVQTFPQLSNLSFGEHFSNTCFLKIH